MAKIDQWQAPRARPAPPACTEESKPIMNFRDMLVHCEECGRDFFFTVEQQRRLAERGMEIVVPQFCENCRQRVTYGGKLHGRIKWFDPTKGYGFIVGDDGKEIFVHRNSVVPTPEGSLPSLEDGQEVLYEAADSPKGPQAVQVTPFEEEQQTPDS